MCPVVPFGTNGAPELMEDEVDVVLTSALNFEWFELSTFSGNPAGILRFIRLQDTPAAGDTFCPPSVSRVFSSVKGTGSAYSLPLR